MVVSAVTENYIKSLFNLSSFEDDTMNLDENDRDANHTLYVCRSPYSAYSVRDSFTGGHKYATLWPKHETGDFMRRDAATLAEMLQPVYLPEDAPLSEQVFGNQARQQKLSVIHFLNLLNERTSLHKKILDDIAHRHMAIQVQLSGAQLHASLDNHGREMKLEGMLMKLEGERRQEEVDFWKTTAELREQLFDNAKLYQALRHRTSLLEGAEPEWDDLNAVEPEESEAAGVAYG